jgi:HK97 family phage major capsid protein
MSDIAQRLTERRLNVWEQMKALADRAIEDKRDLSAEEQGQLDAMNAELDNLDRRVQAFVEADKRSKAIEDHFVNSGTKGDKSDNGGARGEFAQWAREARYGDVREVEARAMSATGGVGPDSVYSRLWEYAVATSQLLESAFVMNTSDGNTLPIPVATAHSALNNTPVAANASLPTSDSTITTVNLSVSKYAFLTLVPSELIQDTNFDLEGYIARNAGRQAGIKLGDVGAAAALSGYTNAGVTAPTGVTTSLGNQATVGQGTDLIIQLYHSVLPEYRSQASTAWLLNDASAAIVRQIKGTTGDSVWQPSLTAGDPDLILGKPVRIVPQLDSFGVTKKPIFFGDIGSLYVRVAGGIRFERSNEYAFGNDQAAFRCIVRTGSVVVDPNAVKSLVTAAT